MDKINNGLEWLLGRQGRQRNNNGGKITEMCLENYLKIVSYNFIHTDIYKITRVFQNILSVHREI